MTQPTLLRLSDTPLTIADPAEDIRGRAVRDNSGRAIGHIEDLFIDDTEKKVRFLEVGSGGFLGLGERKFLIPVDLITRIDKHEVHINRSGDEVAESPLYHPKLAEDLRPGYYNNLYGYYGFAPYWSAGYMYPAFPFYP